MSIWLPNWPLQRILVEQTELKNRPIVLYQTGQRGLHVVTCCHSAAQRGVFTGMPVAEARGLFRADISLAGGENRQGSSKFTAQTGRHEQEPYFHRHDPQADLFALEKLAIFCLCYSPTVGWAETDLPDTLLLDVTGCAHLFQNEQGLAARIAAELRQLGYRVRVASAGTIGAAWALAHYQLPHPQSEDASQLRRAAEKNLPRVAEVARLWPNKPISGEIGYGKFSSPARLKEGSPQASLLSEILVDLPIESLRLDEQTVRTLRELDICRIGQLEALPRTSLPARLGTKVIRRLDQTMGRVDELIVPVRPPEVIAASKSFEHPLTQRAAVETVLRQLAEQLLDKLVRCNAGVLRLQVRLVAAGDALLKPAEQCCSVGFINPCQEVEHLVQMTLSRLSRLVVPNEITEVHVRVTGSSCLETRQVSLLDDQHDCKTHRQFGLLLERMSSRLGEQCVLRPRLRPDAQPEYAYGWETAVREKVGGHKARQSSEGRKQSSGVSDQKSKVKAQEVKTQSIAAARPLAIKSRPVLITVLTAITEGPPIRFRWEGREYVVSRSWGPERIATGWWRSTPIHRDYYRIETDQGQRLWLFYRNQDQAWFLQGEFV